MTEFPTQVPDGDRHVEVVVPSDPTTDIAPLDTASTTSNIVSAEIADTSAEPAKSLDAASDVQEKKEIPKAREKSPSEQIKDANSEAEALMAFAKNKGHEKPDLMGDLAYKLAEFGKVDEAMQYTKLAVETTNSLRNRDSAIIMAEAADKNKIASQEMYQALEDGSRGLKSAAAGIEESANRLSGVTSRMESAIQGMSKTTDQMESSIQGMGHIVSSFTNSVSEFNNGVSRMMNKY